jgi:hypothetical protein
MRIRIVIPPSLALSDRVLAAENVVGCVWEVHFVGSGESLSGVGMSR